MGWLDFKWKVQDYTERVTNFVSGGHLDRKKSNNIVRWAEDQKAEAEARLEKARSDTGASLERLGARKAEILQTTVPEFIQLLELMGRARQRERALGRENLKITQMLTQVGELRAATSQIGQMMLGGAGGTLGGATLAAGAYGLAGLIGTASTGTAIGSLSGAAASNATLAWLGGGALSAGGLGTTGGIALLGGFVAIPAALGLMYFGQNQAKQKLNAARDFRDEVDALEAQINTVVAQTEKIREGAELMLNTIDGLAAVLRLQTEKMRNALKICAQQALELQDALELPVLGNTGMMNKEFYHFIERSQNNDLTGQQEVTA
jgi:regulator of replication initiation timing